jgi:pSer/pThr/pTyr-binding forkhead associated (FHA) protein
MAQADLRRRTLTVWILEGQEPDAGSFSFRFSDGSTKTIGRADGADFIVEAPLVSRVHCRLEAAGGAVTVTDLKSTNGTYINGKRVEQGVLKEGDRLRVGRVEFSVTRSDGPPAAPEA